MLMLFLNNAVKKEKGALSHSLSETLVRCEAYFFTVFLATFLFRLSSILALFSPRRLSIF